MAIPPIARIVLKGMGANRGPSGTKAIIFDGANIGVSTYRNGGGEFHMTLPTTHPSAGACEPWQTHYSVQEWYDGQYVERFAGIITDFDATDNDLIVYGIDYLALLDLVVDSRYVAGSPDAPPPSGSKHVSKTLTEVIINLLDYARTKTNSPVGFIERQFMAVFPEKVTIYSTFVGIGSFIQGLIDSHRQGSGKASRLSVDRKADGSGYAFVLRDDPGQERPNLMMQYGQLVQGFNVIGFGTFASRAHGIGRTQTGGELFYRWANSPGIDPAIYGAIETVRFYDNVTDGSDLARRARQTAAQQAKVGKQLALGLRVEAMHPFVGYDIGDSIPVRIRRGAIDTTRFGSGWWTIHGVEWRINPDGHTELTLAVLPREDGVAPDTDLLVDQPVLPAPLDTSRIADGAVDSSKLADDAVTQPKIAADAVGEPEIQENAITQVQIQPDAVTGEGLAPGTVTGQHLAAELLLASIIKTALSGSRLELDLNGLRAYDTGGELVVNLPTDADSPVSVKGQIQATDLLVLGDAVLRGDGNALAVGSVATLEAAQSDPTQPPTLTSDWERDTKDWQSPSPFPSFFGHGYYDPVGGADGATPCFVQSTVRVSGGVKTFTVHEWNWATGVIERSTLLTGITLDAANGYTPPSITRVGSNWYVVWQEGTGILRLGRFSRATGANAQTQGIGGDFTGWDAFGLSISTDGTDIFVPGGAGTNQLRICRYDTATLTKQATIALTEPTFSGVSLGWPSQYVIKDLGSGNRHFIGLRSTDASGNVTAHNVYEFNLTTGALIADTEFPFPPTNAGYSWNCLVHDGTNFWGRDDFLAHFSKFTNWTWTTASAKYWVGYTWYDSSGSHESLVGPRASITMKRRKRLTISTTSLPGAGGAGEPDSRRAYMVNSASAPSTTALHLQATLTGVSTTLSSYNAAGAAPPVANDLPGGAAAILKSAAGQWQLKGDGSFLYPAFVEQRSRNSNQSIPNGTASFTVVTYDTTIREDTGYSVASGVVTVPRTGLYRCEAQVAFVANATGRRYLGVGVNGSDPINRRRVSQDANSSGGTHLSISVTIALTAGDTVAMAVMQDSGGALNASDGTFTVAYVGT